VSSYAFEISTVSSLDDVEVIVNTAWTNTSAARIIPPGAFDHDTFVGLMAFGSGFSPDFLNSLTAITNGSGTNVFLQYPVEVIETTNGADRVRLYMPAASTNPVPVYTNTVMIANYPEDWIEDVYGDVPAWLSGAERETWFEDRDPWRKHILFDLIATGSVPAYIAMLTNAVNGVDGGTNSVSLSNLYSNDIAFVAMNTGTTGVDLYIHAPTNVPGIDIFRSTNLLDRYGWTLPATVEHVLDPVLWTSDYPDRLNFFVAGNLAADTDNDGLSDARELHLYGTDPTLADSDGD